MDDQLAINRAMQVICEIAKNYGWGAVIYVKCDGRVDVTFENSAGLVRLVVRADLLKGSALPLPGEALARAFAKQEVAVKGGEGNE